MYSFMQAMACVTKMLATVCTGMLCVVIIIILMTLFFAYGIVKMAAYPHCKDLYFRNEEPNVVTLPALHNSSSSKRNLLLAGRYHLSNEYSLKLTMDTFGDYSLCVMKRHFTHVSACVEIGTDEQLQLHVICSPDMRPDCLPGAIVGHRFGLSLWDKEKGTVEYKVVDVDSSEINSWNLTNTTRSLSSLWLDALDCRSTVAWTKASIILGIFLCICCMVLFGCCVWLCWQFEM